MKDVGLVHDWDREDVDDSLSSYKILSALEMRSNKSEHVRLHFIVDCGARREYFRKVLGWMLGENGRLDEGNAQCFFYHAPVTDPERRAEIGNRMQDALGAESGYFNIDRSSDPMLSMKDFPWSRLSSLIVASTQHGIDVSQIAKMPTTSKVWFTGDKGSVNARPQNVYNQMLISCKLCFDEQGTAYPCDSRYVEVPPIDPNGDSGYSRQCTIPGDYLNMFCILSKNHAEKMPGQKNVFKDITTGLSESTRRMFCDRPTNDHNATFTPQDIGKTLLVQDGICFINGKEKEVHWGMVTPPPNMTCVIADVGLTVKLADGTEFDLADGINRRCRINLSNALSRIKMLQGLRPTRELLIITMNESGESIVRLGAQDIEQFASKIINDIMQGWKVWACDTENHTVTDIGMRLNTYSSAYIGSRVDQENTHNIEEWVAVTHSLLATLIMFGAVLCPPPSIQMDSSQWEYVIGEVINPRYCKPNGSIRETTPNYDSAVIDTAYEVVLNGADINDWASVKHEDGHLTICHQSEDIVNKYKARDEQHINHIKLRAIAFTTHRDVPAQAASCASS